MRTIPLQPFSLSAKTGLVVSPLMSHKVLFKVYPGTWCVKYSFYVSLSSSGIQFPLWGDREASVPALVVSEAATGLGQRPAVLPGNQARPLPDSVSEEVRRASPVIQVFKGFHGHLAPAVTWLISK